MAVSNTQPYVEYLANGTATVYSIPFRLIQASDLDVFLDGVEITTGFTVSGVGANTSQITFTAAPGPGVLLLRRNVPLERVTDYQTNGDLLAKTINLDFDRIWCGLQDIFGSLGRALVRPFFKNYYDAEGLPISNLADPTNLQDAATKNWAQQYIGALLKTGQGPVNNSANVVYVGPDGAPYYVQDIVGNAGASLVGATLPNGVRGSALDYLQYLYARLPVILLEKPGVDRTAEILSAIQSMRVSPVSILDDIGGSNITAYSSGRLILGRGVFIIQADQLLFTQDLGLAIEGQGSRRTNNAVHGATTLLVAGTSAGMGVQFKGNGARGGLLKDLDFCYQESGFAGDLLDVFNCPGVTLKRAFLGTYGVSGATRQQTANSLIRTTYDEFLLVDECVFDGAKQGWWSDDVRVSNANTFGGSNTTFKNCVWYDFTQKMVYHRGNRTRIGVTFANCTFNPINVNVQNSLDMRNVEGLDIDNCHFAGSVSNYSVNGWAYIENCKGQLRNSQLDDNCPAGTISGQMDVSNNRIYCTTGWNFTGGVITGKGNTYSKGTVGVTASPTSSLTLDIGPDYFKPDVGYSYQIPTSNLVDGRVNYSLSQDGSANKISNSANGVCIHAVGTPVVSVIGNRTLAAKESGSLFVAAGSAAQTFGLPAPTPGVSFKIAKVVNQALTLTATGSALYTGSGATKTSVASSASDVGGSLTVESIGTSGWRITSQVGSWSYT